MGKEYIIQEETLTSIADAIRTLTSKSDKFLAENFDNEILAFYEEYQVFKQEYEAFMAQYETDKTNLEDIVYGVDPFANVSTTLADNNWETISMVSKAGRASEFWSIGDIIAIDIGGTSYDVRIAGFDHDDVTDASAYGRTKAGITFEMVDCYGTTYAMNSDDTNIGGWTESEMRTTHLPVIKTLLSSELTNVIIPVNKLTSEGRKSTTTVTASDDLFLLSEVEIFGSTSHSVAGEGSQYAYYAAGNSKVKTRSGSISEWWERSPCWFDSVGICYVTSGGAASNGWPSATIGVSFGFCV